MFHTVHTYIVSSVCTNTRRKYLCFTAAIFKEIFIAFNVISLHITAVTR